jgi:hypothetical protein
MTMVIAVIFVTIAATVVAITAIPIVVMSIAAFIDDWRRTMLPNASHPNAAMTIDRPITRHPDIIRIRADRRGHDDGGRDANWSRFIDPHGWRGHDHW